MLLGAVLLVLGLAVVAVQTRGIPGAWRWTVVTPAALLVLGWCVLEWAWRQEAPLPEDLTADRPVPSQTCARCHESHHASWQRTYHRTMTREATPDNVKADFSGVEHHYRGVVSQMSRLKENFFIETIDPEWEMALARDGVPAERAGPPRRRLFNVNRVVGSHWFQQMLSRDEQGRYLRLPMVYHLVEGRWIHIDGAFLSPDGDHFHNKVAVWNETCVYCHNTRPVKNPEPVPGQMPGYRTEVGELGIACETCHGAGERHVQAHRNPARRLAQHSSEGPDPTIVNPARLDVPRSDEVCAHCHGGTMPRFEAWDRRTDADPYLPGRELARFWHVLWSEGEANAVRAGAPVPSGRQRPGPLDGRFWGDGTPLTTAAEYQGMALSACYQGGAGRLRCLTCHTMHQGDPNHQLKAGMRTNEACYGCHADYRGRLAEHTHHPVGSPGSLCYNCHMPHQVYSLLDTHRSHRIAIPRVQDSVGTGKPHACNLCHLDRSLGWTAERLREWYGTRPEPLGADEQTVAYGLLHLARDDARTRAVLAGAFGQPAAQQASGRDWSAPFLRRALEQERYQAVRYLLHRSLRSLVGRAADSYDYQGSPSERAAQLRAVSLSLEGSSRLEQGRYPYLPLTPAGNLDKEAVERFLRTRNDPDVFITE